MDNGLEMEFESPHEFGVPHTEWRPSQKEALQYVLQQFEQDQRFVVCELPTGVGKSSIATALGRDRQVLVLVHTLSLLDQYAEKYGFSVVKGTREYACVNPERVDLWQERYQKRPTAADCPFPKMSECPVAEECLYLQAREKALAATRMGCTYKYASLSPQVQRRGGVVVLDEAHSAADEILDSEEFVIHEQERQRFNFPRFPFAVAYGKGGKGDHLKTNAKKILVDWLLRCLGKVSAPSADWEPEEQQAYRSAASKFQRLLETMDSVEWFLEAGPSCIERSVRVHGRYQKQWVPGLRLRPLSARAVASRLWESKSKALLMSATIGNPDPLMQELGIEHYQYQSYPHPTPVAYRPVFDLQVDRMTHLQMQRNPTLQRDQAQAIVKFIAKWPPKWRGLVLASSFEKIKVLRAYLGEAFPERLANHNLVTDMEQWLAEMESGSIAIQTMQGWGHGIDLYGDRARMLVMAGVPFRNPTDLYQKVKQEIYGENEYYWWSSYVSVPQATGRVTRGEQDADGNWLLNVSALADGSAMTNAAKRFYPKWFREAIVPF